MKGSGRVGAEAGLQWVCVGGDCRRPEGRTDQHCYRKASEAPLRVPQISTGRAGKVFMLLLTKLRFRCNLNIEF